MKHLKTAPAFTLIELLMAIVIGGIVFIPLIVVFASPLIQNVSVESLPVGLNLAQAKMEKVLSKDFGAISAESSAAFDGNFTNFSSTVTVNYVSSTEPDTVVDPITTNYKKIKVSVTSSADPSMNIQITTLVTNVHKK